jgi:hypothetical protein
VSDKAVALRYGTISLSGDAATVRESRDALKNAYLRHDVVAASRPAPGG